MEAKNIKVVILCGGRGMRLHEATEHMPKPLIEIGEKPILWHIMKMYSHYGYHDFTLCLGYKGDMIKRYFLDYELMNSDFTINPSDKSRTVVHSQLPELEWRVTLAETGLNALTGARIKRISKYIDSDLLMITYGDAVADVDINRLVAFHKSHNKIGTITAVRQLSRFGEIKLGKDGTIEEFREKAAIQGDYINGGFGVFDRRLFDYLEDDDSCMFEKAALERMAKDRQLAAFIHQGYWQCMDTYRDWEALNRDWENDSPPPPWKVWA